MIEWLRKHLYIHNITAGITEAINETRKLRLDTEMLRRDIAIHNQALGRIIAKLDPLYGVPEDDPQRRKESDEISNQVIKKLYAEHMARKYQEGQ